MQNISFIILAAGKGTRMRSDLPKALHKVAGLALIDHLLLTITKNKHKNSEIILVVDKDAKELISHISENYPEVKFAFQEEKLGTGHAFRCGVKEVQNKKSDLMVLYADSVFVSEATIKKMNALLQKDYEKTALVLLGFESIFETAHGRLITSSKENLTEIREYVDCTDKEKEIDLCNQGSILINASKVDLVEKIQNKNSKKEYYLTDLVKIASEEGLVCKYYLVDELESMSVNSREELASAEFNFQAILRNKFLENGVTMIDPSSVFFSFDTKIENDVQIEPNVFIGPNVSIAKGARIRAFSYIEGAKIGKNVTVGPFARVRPGTDLKEGAKIGNFVEIKNSIVHKDSKINHLSYIGDSDIGEKVNVGAGTITCNYDGVKKHKTKIGAGAFIGSNVCLIAPVDIGEHALIGAGSVITKNVGRKELGITRAEQKNLKRK